MSRKFIEKNKIQTEKCLTSKIQFDDGREAPLDRKIKAMFVDDKGKRHIELHIENIAIGYDIMQELQMSHDIKINTIQVFGKCFNQRKPIRLRLNEPENVQSETNDIDQNIRTQLKERIEKYYSKTDFKNPIRGEEFTINLTNNIPPRANTYNLPLFKYEKFKRELTNS